MTKMAVVYSRHACTLADDAHRPLEAATLLHDGPTDAASIKQATETTTQHSEYHLSNQVTCPAAADPDVTRVQTAQA